MTETISIPEVPTTGKWPLRLTPPPWTGRFVLLLQAQPVVGLRCAAVSLMVVGAFTGWLQPVLSEPLSAIELFVAVPGGPFRAVTFGLILLMAVALAIAGLIRLGRRQRLWNELAALLAVTSTVGFLLQAAFVDTRVQERVSHDRSDLTNLQLLVGYKIPRPDVTTLGPIPLPDGAAEVFSALRLGFFLALTGALLFTATLSRQPKGVGVDRAHRLGRWAVGTMAVLLFAVPVVDSALAHRDLDRARDAAANGDDAAAVALYESALRPGVGLDADPDVVSDFGMSQVRLRPTDSPASVLATSRLQLQAGNDLPALNTVVQAIDRWPMSEALRDEFAAQAFDYLRRRGAPAGVRQLMSPQNDSAILRIALAKYELPAGDNPAATADAIEADGLTTDSDVRSVALTFLSIAQSRSGDLTTGRQTLLAAVESDTEYVNVMARSLLTGLYTTLPQ